MIYNVKIIIVEHAYTVLKFNIHNICVVGPKSRYHILTERDIVSKELEIIWSGTLKSWFKLGHWGT